jgi:hypothetical protein
MAGGIFKDRPFVFNPKCIVFSFYSALLFAAGGGKNPLILAMIFIMAYVLMAWYDKFFDCSDLLNTGTGIGIDPSPIFKPQYREQGRNVETDLEEEQLAENQEKEYLKKVYFFHAVFVAPLLLYASYYGKESNDRTWGFLGGMGGIALIYHGLRLKFPREVWK